MRVPVAPHTCQQLILFIFFHFSHSNRSLVVTHWRFNSKFFNDEWWWVYLHILVLHLYIILCEICQDLLSIFKSIFKIFLLLSFKSPLCILESSPLSNMYFANIFFQYIFCIFILFTVFFAKWGFKLFIKSNESFFFFNGSHLVYYI